MAPASARWTIVPPGKSAEKGEGSLHLIPADDVVDLLRKAKIVKTAPEGPSRIMFPLGDQMYMEAVQCAPRAGFNCYPIDDGRCKCWPVRDVDIPEAEDGPTRGGSIIVKPVAACRLVIKNDDGRLVFRCEKGSCPGKCVLKARILKGPFALKPKVRLPQLIEFFCDCVE